MFRKQIFSGGFVLCLAMIGVLATSTKVTVAQTIDRGVYYGGSVVGGVAIDANGALSTAPKSAMEAVGKELAKLLEPIPADLNEKTPIRKVSLKKLEAEMRQIIDKKGEFPDAMRYLGGLTAIRYVVVVPEENDILLVGPAESWTVDALGSVIGKSSGRPVLRLEDFLTIFRAWNNQDRPSVITCSIDPTPEAMRKIAQVESQFRVLTKENINAYAAAQEEAYGMNVVTVQGVPADSRFAKILVAADYKMKRIGLGHEDSGVRGLPSYVSMISGSQKQRTPRFWLAPEYGVVSHDSKKLTWQLSEVKVKALTENEYVDLRSGSRQSAGKPDKAAISWCDKMNNNYDALSKVDPVFGDLKNCMELAMTVALIKRERLMEKVDCKLPTIAEETVLKIAYPAPKTVPSKAVISRNARSFVVACGGVEINPFVTLENAKLESKIDAERETLSKTVGDAWWSK